MASMNITSVAFFLLGLLTEVVAVAEGVFVLARRAKRGVKPASLQVAATFRHPLVAAHRCQPLTEGTPMSRWFLAGFVSLLCATASMTATLAEPTGQSLSPGQHAKRSLTATAGKQNSVSLEASLTRGWNLASTSRPRTVVSEITGKRQGQRSAVMLPVSLKMGKQSQMRYIYAAAGSDLGSRDPVAATVQGFGLASGFGKLKTDSQVYFYRPQLDGGAAATLVRQYKHADARQGVDPKRLLGGQALKHSLRVEGRQLQLTGVYQDIDSTFVPSARLLAGGSDPEAVKRLQEMAAQYGTRRIGMGLTYGLSKGLSFSGRVDTAGDGAGHIHTQEFGLSSKLFRVNSTRQDVDAAFQGFQRFVDPQVQQLAAARGVQRRSFEWALTPSKTFGIEGNRTIRRDAGGRVDSRELKLNAGALQFSDRQRDVAGFKTFAALGSEKELQKIAGVKLGETEASLKLRGSSRLSYTSTRMSDAGGKAEDTRFAFESRTINARARFRDTAGGFKTAAGVAQFKQGYQDLAGHLGLREAIYDLDYVGSKRFGLRNHYEQVKGGAGNDAWTRTNWSNTIQLNMGKTTAEAFRSQTGTTNASGSTTREQVERYQVRRAIQKDGFVFGLHETQRSHDAEGKRSIVQTDQLQTRLSVGGLFNLEGQRLERRSTGIGMERQDDVTVSRQLGKGITAAWNFRDRDDREGREEAQKLSVSASLWKGSSFTGSREVRLNQAADQTTGITTTDARWTLDQQLGKSTKIALGFARVKAGNQIVAGEESMRITAEPLGQTTLAADFTQRKQAGKPVGVIKGFTLGDKVKNDRFDWALQYRRRSANLGQPIETKGWTASYKGAGKSPLTLTASYLRNPMNDKGVAAPIRQSALDISSGIGAKLVATLSYRNALNEAERKADEQTTLTLRSGLATDPAHENIALSLGTQVIHQAAQRARVNSVRFEYVHGVGEVQAFAVGADLKFREDRGQGHSSEYRADVKWVRSF